MSYHYIIQLKDSCPLTLLCKQFVNDKTMIIIPVLV